TQTWDVVVAVGVFRVASRGAEGPDASVRDRTRRPVLRTVDDRQRHARRVAVGVDRVLGVEFGDGPRGGDGRAGIGSGPLLRAGATASGRGDRAAGERREPASAREGRLPRGRAAAALPRRRRRLAGPPVGGDHSRGSAGFGGVGAGPGGSSPLGLTACSSRASARVCTSTRRRNVYRSARSRGSSML